LRKAITKIHGNNGMKIKLYAVLTRPTKINKDVRQICPISPTLFNTYVNQIITEWKDEEIKGIKIQLKKDVNALLFVGDQLIVADSEDALQISLHKLETVTSKYGIKVETSVRKQWILKEGIQ